MNEINVKENEVFPYVIPYLCQTPFYLIKYIFQTKKSTINTILSTL